MKNGYLFRLEHDLTIFMNAPKEATIERRWLYLRDNYLVVKKGYAWDGCSPKYNVLGMLLGTPEGAPASTHYPSTYYPSLVHDALYQYAAVCEKQGIERHMVDAVFFDMMKIHGVATWMCWTYYLAVRLLGRKHWKATDPVPA